MLSWGCHPVAGWLVRSPECHCMGEKTNTLQTHPQASPSLPGPPLHSLPLLLPPCASQYPRWSLPELPPASTLALAQPWPWPNLGLGPEERIADIADFLVESPLFVHTLNAAIGVVLGWVEDTGVAVRQGLRAGSGGHPHSPWPR